jgi:hypothetical protein
MSGTPVGLRPPTNTSALGHGAVGGPRGVAAATTQVLVNFILNYDRGRLAEIAQDLNRLKAEQATNAKEVLDLTKKHADAVKAASVAESARAKLIKAGVDDSAEALKLQNQYVAAQKKGAVFLAEDNLRRQELLAKLALSKTLTDAEALALDDELALTQAREAALARVNEKIRQGVALSAEEVAFLREKQQIEAARSGVGGRLGALGLGLVAGTIGGLAISSLIMEPLQTAIEGVGDSINKIINPTERAREAMKRLADEINSIAESEGISQLEAAAQVLERLSRISLGGGNLNTAENRALLERIALSKQLVEVLNAQTDLYKAQKGELADLRDAARQNLMEQQGTVINPYEGWVVALSGIVGLQPLVYAEQVRIDREIAVGSQGMFEQQRQQNAVAAATEAAAEAQRDAAEAAREYADELSRAAVEAASAARISDIEQGLESTVDRLQSGTEAAIDSIRRAADAATDAVRRSGESRIDALQDQLRNLELTPSARTTALERQLEALKDAGPSQRTKELADQIERLNDAQEKAAFRAQLDNIDNEKRLILLRERLSLTGKEIDLDKYQGKERLVAIEALLAREKERNEAHERFVKLLELQYQIQQGVRRQQGETIQEFISRRTQYYRGLLAQAAELREGPEAELEAERDRVQTSIDLKELEERRRKLIEDRARKQRLDSLQEQLQASKDRDRQELESRRDALQKQLEASRQADQDALESKRQALQDQIEAVRENTREHIERINEQRDNEIDARERARDRAIETAEAAAEAAIKAEQARAAAIENWASYAETQRMITVFKGAQSMADLQRYAGGLHGALYALSYLQQSGQYLGLDPATQAALLSNTARAFSAYTQRMQEFAKEALRPPWSPTGANIGRLAEGGLVRLGNFNTPLNRDVRWGDGNGDEIGMNLGGGLGAVLSNKVVQALRDEGAGGGVNFEATFQSVDPYADQARFERRVRSIVREEMK